MKKILIVFFASISCVLADTSTPPTASFGTSTINVLQSSGQVIIPVKVSGPPLVDFFGTTVRCSTVNGTATWPRDFDSPYPEVSFHTGETSKDMIMGISTSPEFSGTRTFTVHLNNSSYYNIGSPSTVTINIVHDVTPKSPEIDMQQPLGTSLVDGMSTKNFGTVRAYTYGPTKTFTIKNIGNVDLTGLAITKTGAAANDFVVTTPSPVTLTPGGSTTFKVTFRPSLKGTRSATIQIKSNDANENPFDIKLKGVSS